MADLLLELFSEEIPARMQEEALAHLQKALQTRLGQPGKGFVTPRRLAVVISNLPVVQPDVTTELRGPKVSAPDAALQGFLKKNSLKKNALVERDGIYFATLHQKGKKTAEMLKPLIEEILASFPWPKSMRWGTSNVTWVRPLHSILCIFNGKIVPVQYGTVKAGNTTHGHRFLSPKKIKITAGDYESALEKSHVIADRNKRKADILQQAERLAAKKSVTLRKDEGLLDEVTGLVEWPVVLMGAIDPAFMDLPPEVLSTVMKKHQKYFSLLLPFPFGRAKGESTPPKFVPKSEEALAPHFLVTANIEAKDGGKAIVAGNERVLRARFADARFFWDQDRRKPLSDWADGLRDMTFHARLGSVDDKVERIRALASALVDYVPDAERKLVHRAAELCKADLVTGMVGEFAELQGIMGRYYALEQGEDESVADAIRDHYRPQGPNDIVPTNPVSVCVALADKLDTLIAMFAIGEKPTGSKDPYALRRAALGVIRIILDNNLRISLRDFLKADLLEFLADRLKVQLKDSGIRHDVISAVVADGDDDLVRIALRANALQQFLASTDGANLLIAYRRAANILGIEEKKDKTAYRAAELNSNALSQAEEINLAAKLTVAHSVQDRLRHEEQFTAAMQTLADLRASVDQFFDKIMVNCDNRELRANRLRLLDSIRGNMDRIANFALIEG